MNVTVKDFPVPSSDGIHTLAGHVYLPDGQIRGVLHVVHGMAEHIARYDPFMRAMAADGWLTCGYDHLGHGHTVRDASELGYIAPKRGYDLLARDVAAFYAAVCEQYELADKPYALMGHSMGSFVVRYATSCGYVKPAHLIVMGTGGPNPIAGVGLAVIGLVKRLRGGHHVSDLVENLAFGSYNNRFGGGGEGADGYQWLNTLREPVEVYCADPLCGYRFTVSGMSDLVTLTSRTNQRKWFKSLPSDVRVLLVSGQDDPVGDYGRGVTAVRDRLCDAGVAVKCHLYEGARHEILLDTCADTVLADIRAFLNE